MKSKGVSAMVLGAVLLLSGPAIGSLCAQEGKRSAAMPSSPSGLEIAFEWQYSCPDSKGCSFSCPGSGGASNVTKLRMYLGSISLSGAEHAAGIFYEFSTLQIPRANGFAITTGISTLSCQVVGMNLDVSGPRDGPTASLPASR